MTGYHVIFPIFALSLPLLLIGVIRKLKARFQNRIGAPLYQPLIDVIKFLKKGQVISEHASLALGGASALSCAVCMLLTLSAPWLGVAHSIIPLDIFTFIYLLVFVRLATLLVAIDPNSPFGGFGASREVLLSVLVEPAVMLCLVSLAVAGKSTMMSQLFSFSDSALLHHSGLWLLAGCGLYISSLVELSRMPADDPTTHLELTMTHEAMILENSGPNLAAVQYTAAMKLAVLLGISGQCFLHAIGPLWTAGAVVQVVASCLTVVILAGSIAVIEGTVTKLRWTKLPEFIAYAVGFGLLCLFQAIGGA